MSNFDATKWSLIRRIRSDDKEESIDALDLLCRTYWLPLYAEVRRTGATPLQAEESTQAFFYDIIRSNLFARAEEENGRLRSFLLKCFQNFVREEYRREKAIKRGGDVDIISLDFINAEAGEASLGSGFEPGESQDSAYFDRQWAKALLGRSLARLRSEHDAKEKEALFLHFSPLLSDSAPSSKYPEIAAKLKLSEGAVKVAWHRFLKRYRNIVREEVARTLLPGDDIDEEIRYLCHAASQIDSDFETSA